MEGRTCASAADWPSARISEFRVGIEYVAIRRALSTSALI